VWGVPESWLSIFFLEPLFESGYWRYIDISHSFGLISLGIPNIIEKNQKNTHLIRPKGHFPITHPKKPNQNIERKKMIKASINGKPQITGMPTINKIARTSNKNRHI
jgi:hypothetical protein